MYRKQKSNNMNFLRSSRWHQQHLLIVVHIAGVLALANTETIHYTNSPVQQHQQVFHVNDDNFTSYKLTVPGSDPITIIESTSRLNQHRYSADGDHVRYADGDQQHSSDSEREIVANNRKPVMIVAAPQASTAAKVIQHRNGERYSEKELVSRSPSQQQQHALLHRLKNTQNQQHVRVGSLGLQITSGASSNDDDHLLVTTSEKSKVIDDDDDDDHEDMIDGDADGGVGISSDRHGGASNKKVIYSPMLLQKFIEEYTHKMNTADQSTKNALKEIEKLNNPTVSDAAEPAAAATTTDRIDFNDHLVEQKYWDDRSPEQHQTQQKASYRPNQHQNPFNDKKGWVTLDAVPWSTSKVSKWHPHKGDSSSGNSYRPATASAWNENPIYSRPPRPASYADDEAVDDYDVDAGRPIRPPSSYNFNPYRVPNNSEQRPKPSFQYDPPNQSSYEAPPRPSKFRPRPTQYDYAGAASSNQNQYFVSHSLSFEKDKWYDQDDGASTSKPWSEDLITDTRPSNFPSNFHYQQNDERKKRPTHQRPADATDQDRYEYHPFSHPESGNGEWVLVSTTKGYQQQQQKYPNRQHGQRAMKPSSQAAQQQATNEVRRHHSVRLTVLPPLDNDDDAFSHDGRRRPMALSHGGMLEVEPSFNSVDESVASAFSSQRNQTETALAPSNVKKRRIFKGVPVKSRISSGQDASAVLAAVGAGMVPATMAMLMPIMLGRRKRSIRTNETIVVD